MISFITTNFSLKCNLREKKDKTEMIDTFYTTVRYIESHHSQKAMKTTAKINKKTTFL